MVYKRFFRWGHHRILGLILVNMIAWPLFFARTELFFSTSWFAACAHLQVYYNLIHLSRKPTSDI